jgi:hypothetical protein
MAGVSPRRSITAATNLMNSMTRSERDLTKVTKVRVRTNTKENSSVPGTFIKQRTKMKTTTMIVSDTTTPTSSMALQTTGNRDLVNIRQIFISVGQCDYFFLCKTDVLKPSN